MRATIAVFKALLGACVLVATTGALAVLPVDPFSRWSEKPELQGATYLYAGGPANAAVVLLRYNEGPLRSFDGGVTWAPFTLPGVTYEIFLAPTAARTWYTQVGGAIYRTVDGGDTWELRSPAPPPSFVSSDISVSANADVLYRSVLEFPPCEGICSMGPAKGATVQVSSDGARNWRDLGAQRPWVRAFASPVETGLVFVVDGHQVLKSTNQGETLSTLTLPAQQTYSVMVTPDRNDAAIVHVADRGTMYPSSVYSSRDGGLTWNVNQLPTVSRIHADPGSPGRAFAFAYFEGAYETRDAGRTWVHAEHFFHAGLNEDVDAVVARGAKRFALNAEFHKLTQLDLNDGALALESDLWWNPAESGTGLSITHRGTNQTFIAWFAYDQAGAQVWRVVPGGSWTDRTFSGDVYQTYGPAFFGAEFSPSRVHSQKVGRMTLRFDDQDHAILSYQLGVNGESANKRIERQRFGPPLVQQVTYETYGDLWWNPAESGWGMAINHQYDNIFAAWYVYDASGNPIWIVMPDAKVVMDGNGDSARPKATGKLYTTRGPSSNAPFDPAQVVAVEVGTATLSFTTEDTVTLQYTALGASSTCSLTRQPF